MTVSGNPVNRILAAGIILAAAGVTAADKAASSYTPVAPPRALHTALKLNLRIAQDWLNDKDYTSAGQTAQGLIVLAQLYGYQSAHADWQQRTRALAEASGWLLAATKKKDAAACEQSVTACARLLEELAQHPPVGPKVTVKHFAPFGSTKTWMLLQDGAYTDAKSTQKPAELEDLAFTLAETLSVTSHLRNEANWQTMSVNARQAALAIAGKAATDPDGARRELKHLASACEACHQGYKK